MQHPSKVRRTFPCEFCDHPESTRINMTDEQGRKVWGWFIDACVACAMDLGLVTKDQP